MAAVHGLYSREPDAAAQVGGHVGDGVVELVQQRLPVRDLVAVEGEVFGDVALAGQHLPRERHQQVTARLRREAEGLVRA